MVDVEQSVPVAVAVAVAVSVVRDTHGTTPSGAELIRQLSCRKLGERRQSAPANHRRSGRRSAQLDVSSPRESRRAADVAGLGVALAAAEHHDLRLLESGGGTVDPKEPPVVARSTRCIIIATGFLLLVASILLVAVTLRLAPFIDELGKRQAAQMIQRGL